MLMKHIKQHRNLHKILPLKFYIVFSFQGKEATFFFFFLRQWIVDHTNSISRQPLILGWPQAPRKTRYFTKEVCTPCLLTVIIYVVYLTDSFRRYLVLTHPPLVTCSSPFRNVQSAACLLDNHYRQSFNLTCLWIILGLHASVKKNRFFYSDLM